MAVFPVLLLLVAAACMSGASAGGEECEGLVGCPLSPCRNESDCPHTHHCRAAVRGGGCSDEDKECAPRGGVGAMCRSSVVPSCLWNLCEEGLECHPDSSRNEWVCVRPVPACSTGPCVNGELCEECGAVSPCCTPLGTMKCCSETPMCSDGDTPSETPCGEWEVKQGMCYRRTACCKEVYCRVPSCEVHSDCPLGKFCRLEQVSSTKCGVRKVCTPRAKEGASCGGFAMDACRVKRCEAGTMCTGSVSPGRCERVPDLWNCTENRGWSVGKREWCCAVKQVGCPVPVTCANGPCKADEVCEDTGRESCVVLPCIGYVCRARPAVCCPEQAHCGKGETESTTPCSMEEAKSGCWSKAVCCDRVYCRTTCESHDDCKRTHYCRQAFADDGECAVARECVPRIAQGELCTADTTSCKALTCARSLTCTFPTVLEGNQLVSPWGSCAPSPQCAFSACAANEECVPASPYHCERVACCDEAPECSRSELSSSRPCSAEEVEQHTCTRVSKCCLHTYCRTPLYDCTLLDEGDANQHRWCCEHKGVGCPECECEASCGVGKVRSAVPCSETDQAAGLCWVEHDCCQMIFCRPVIQCAEPAQCNANGTFAPEQCDDEGCWCVDPLTGTPVGPCSLHPTLPALPSLATSPPTPPFDSPCNSAPCGEAMCIPMSPRCSDCPPYRCTPYPRHCCTDPPQCPEGVSMRETPCLPGESCWRVVQCCMVRYCLANSTLAPKVVGGGAPHGVGSEDVISESEGTAYPPWTWILVAVICAAVVLACAAVVARARSKPPPVENPPRSDADCELPEVRGLPA